MSNQLKKMATAGALSVLLATASCTQAEPTQWVGTWGTARQLVEPHNNPPAPGLGGNSIRQIVQVSIGGEEVRLRLTNEFSTDSTEIQAIELSHATTSGSSYEVDEATTVSLTFDGQPGITMAPGGTATSDAVKFPMGPRQNVAITIHYGQASSTSVTGHPGSRTTSYLAEGNTTDFTQAVRTDHWYTILGLDVKAGPDAGAIAILGNSITDGRGSTTNQQNRWPDVLSRRLLANEATQNVAVLNMGIGGNCMLGSGLGPAGKDRYTHDLLEQPGVKWIILFEAVNDLGWARDAMWSANAIIDLYTKIINEAHAKGIRVLGGTITPFKNNGYYTEDHEAGRQHLNQWMRTTPLLDGVIEMEHAVRDPQDTLSMHPDFLFENDYLHPNAKGYEAMGNIVDLSLFTTPTQQ
ncbi:MAG: SGNH/GDSL hydrolase family protein [Bacteroidaceae bacterium]|nr:SGNH/GDSL hydrolase family protein [Bacteroidaceae bacterium]